MRIFAEVDLSAFLEAQRVALTNEIRSENKNKLLNVNGPDYVEYLVEKYAIPQVEIYADRVWVSAREELVRAEFFPIFMCTPGSHIQSKS